MSRNDRLIAGGLFIAGLLLYIITLAPSVVALFDDSLEFQLVAYRLGIAHPTGYPLYTMLGWLFTRLPVGNIAYRVNLMSAVFGAATVALLYLFIVQHEAVRDLRTDRGTRGESPRIPPGLSRFPEMLDAPAQHAGAGLARYAGGVFGAAMLALGPVFWGQATIAEVYTLNAFFVVLLLWLAGQERLFWLAFVAGLSLTHHRTMLLLFPALALYILPPLNPPRRGGGESVLPPAGGVRGGRWSGFSLRQIVGMIGLFLLPLLLYLYLPLRGYIGSLDGSYQNTWTGFWRQVGGGGYGTFLFDNPFGHQREAAFYWRLLQSQSQTVIPGLIGLLYLIRTDRRRLLLLTGLAFVCYTGFNLFYRVSDIAVFFIPVFLIWAAWSGWGMAFAWRIVLSRRSRSVRLIGGGLVIAISLFILGRLFVSGYPVRDRWQAHDYGLDILAQPLAEEAPIVGILGEMTLIRYFQQTENLRPDLRTIAADREAERLAAVEKLLAESGGPVYLTRPLPGAAERWPLDAVGPLIRLRPGPEPTPPPLPAENPSVAAGIHLAEWRLTRPPQTGPGPVPVRLTLVWQPTQPITADLKVSVRLLAADGQPVATADAVPVHFAYPTSAWRPGELVADAHTLALPPETIPGPYTPRIIWYDPARSNSELGRLELPAFNLYDLPPQ